MPAVLAVLILLMGSPIAPSWAQDRGLGPKERSTLAPTDTARVAVGEEAPDFTLESLAGPPITLSQFRGKQNVVLAFYRGHW
jgi:cytochrome oxidase Cu insertion factor (SCO1/SenC/PrrC family)